MARRAVPARAVAGGTNHARDISRAPRCAAERGADGASALSLPIKKPAFGENDFDNLFGQSTLPALDGVVAQLVEHHNGIVGVRGSNPLGSTILFRP
jgi:hypothetical protein